MAKPVGLRVELIRRSPSPSEFRRRNVRPRRLLGIHSTSFCMLHSVLHYRQQGWLFVKNVQISFDEDLLDAVDEIAESLQLSRSAIVREALKTWIRQKEVKNFEEAWIARLKEKPQDLGDAEAWLKAESWGEE